MEAPISLDAFAGRVCSSSNFSFAWQWFHCMPPFEASPANARAILDTVVESPECHRFLRDSFASDSGQTFSIQPLHEHCGFVRTGGAFEQTLARAAADRLGAYSRDLSEATPAQVREVHDLFGSLGAYSAYELVRGEVAECAGCARYDSILFTNWFYDVAWDWCFCLIWESKSLAWVGCLTDTD